MKPGLVRLLFVLSIAQSCLPAAEDSGKPNFILILADDLGYGDTGAYGSKQIPTPSIDGLAESGALFTSAYVSSPVCSPSRAGILTGRHQATFGHVDNLTETQPGFDRNFAGLPVGEKTLADRLKERGYTTGIIGKWHLGELPSFRPERRGFDKFWGYLAGSHDYFIADAGETGSKGSILCNYKNPARISYLTDDTGDECVDFIRQNKKGPFFLYAAFGAPHSPMQATDEDLKLFAHVEDKLRRTYCAMVHRLDQNVGKILQALKEENLEQNTVVVFMSDNGGPCAAPISNGSVNAPLRGQKTTLLEGGIRVPLVLRWPQKTTAGTRINTTVSALDLCPTFVQAAGGSFASKEDTGIDLMPLITGKEDRLPKRSLKWTYTVSWAIREGDWKLIQLPDRLPMLFNLAEDISEQENVALLNVNRTEAMLKKLGSWEVRLPHPVFREPADWRIRHLGFYDADYQLVQPE